MKKFNWLLLFALLPLLGFGQEKLRQLSGVEIPGVYAFSTSKKEALVMICFSAEMQNVSFKTNFEEPINIFKREKDHQDSVLYLRFPVGDQWEYRRLNVVVPNFASCIITLFDLQPKEGRKFRVIDPDAQTLGCYYQMTKEALAAFQNSLYEEARERYIAAKKCAEIDEGQMTNLNEQIARMDTIITTRKLADMNFDALNFDEARKGYIQVFSFNRDDNYAMEQVSLCQQKLSEYCAIYLENADDLVQKGEYQKAINEYQKIVDQACPNMITANRQIQKLNKILDSKKNREKVILYDFDTSLGAYLGFSYGKYKMRKAGSYLTVRFNPELFKMIRENNTEDAKPEVDFSFGWTVKIVKPVWIFFGPGYTGVVKYNKDEDRNGNETLKPSFFHAVSPEIGLLGKIGPVALRYTFQYRVAINKDHADDIGKMRHMVGVGYCF